VIHGTHFFYPRMSKRGSGHIVNIASAAGLIPLPMLSAYSGTKSAVVTMTRVWRAEGAVHGVGFTAICPSMMNTNVKRSFRICTDAERKSPSEDTIRKADRFLAIKRFDPAHVAEAIVRAVERNRGVVPVGLETHLFDLANRFSRRLVDFVLKVSAYLGERWS
jgi:short-subunit dehydrogenase